MTDQNLEKTPESPALPSAQDRRQRYNQIVREAQLAVLLLSKVDFKVNRSVAAEEGASKLSYAGRLVEIAHMREQGACGAGVEWLVEIKKGRKQLARCTARYDIIYDGFDSYDDEIVAVFVENVAQPATYTYFRALFANLDWSAELHTPPLPVIKFYPKI
jgi:hypothetical protein